MLAPFYFSISFGIAIFFMASSSVQAQNFVLPAGLQASWCSTSWSVSGSTYTCTGGSGKVTFPDNAVISSGSAVVFLANAGFELNNAKLGSVDSKISLRAPNGGGHVKSAAGAEVSGYIETLGTVDLIDTKVGEHITANGNIEISGGSVKLKVTSTNNKVIAEGADLLGGALGHSGITIVGGNISGDFTAHSNAITLTDVTMSSGSIDAGGNNIKVSGGSLKANITDANNVEIIDGALVSGNVQARYSVKLKGSKVRGDIYGRSGYDLQNVDLRESFVYGSVTVGTSWQTITGDNISRIYVSCTYGSVNPPSLCEGGGIPPDPVEPVECDVSLEVGPMIAGMSHYATVTALDEPLSCKTPQVLRFLFNYINPDPRPGYHNPLPIFINGKEIAEGESEEIPGVEWEGRKANLTIEYKEAGELYLALLDADEQVVSRGDEVFISRPYGLCLETDLNHDEELLFKGKDGGEPIHSAGDDFDLRIRAVAWREDAESIDDVREAEAICGNPLLLNYRQYSDEKAGWESIKLEAVLIDPELEGGAPEITLGRATHDHTDSGQMTLPDQSISEVGIFMIKAIPPKYLEADMSHAISLSRRIGRIVPAYLEVTSNKPLLQPNCVTNSETQAGFSYQGQAINFDVAPTLTITGKNRAGVTTTNYDRDDFWRWQSSNFIHTPEFGSDDRTIHDNSRLSGNPNFEVETKNPILGDGAQEVTISGQALTYARNLYEPLASDAAFHPYLALRFPMTDQDGVCYKSDDTSRAAPCKPYVLDNFSFPEANSQIRLGRAVLENANGSELAPLNMPLVIESWQGSYFARTSDDSCTVFPEEPEPELSDYTDNLNTGETEASMEGAGANRFVKLTAPGLGNEGSVRVTPTVPELLRYDWDGSGSFQNPSGLATFGIYQGSKPLIFRREVYR